MQRIYRHLSYANVAATLALVFAMTGGAIAATGGFSSGGKLQACVGSDGTIKLLRSGQKCHRGQQKVAWNQTGPKGTTGATGASGPAGPAGPAGASGQPSSVMWGRVNAEGNLQAGHGVISSEGNGETPPVTVTFERDVTNCAVVATQNSNVSTHVVSTAKTEGATAKVSLIDAEGKPTINPFSIVAVC